MTDDELKDNLRPTADLIDERAAQQARIAVISVDELARWLYAQFYDESGVCYTSDRHGLKSVELDGVWDFTELAAEILRDVSTSRSRWRSS